MVTYFERALKWFSLILFLVMLVLYAFGIGEGAV